MLPDILSNEEVLILYNKACKVYDQIYYMPRGGGGGGIEPRTFRLRGECSTDWANPGLTLAKLWYLCWHNANLMSALCRYMLNADVNSEGCV